MPLSLSSIPWKFLLGLSFGLVFMGMYHGYVMRGIELADSKQESRQKTAIIEQKDTDAEANDANVFQYLEQITAANQEADSLRKRLADGSISLRMCNADVITARVQAGNSDAAKAKAEADLAAYREDVVELIRRGKELDAWVDAAHEFINRGSKESPR